MANFKGIQSDTPVMQEFIPDGGVFRDFDPTQEGGLVLADGVVRDGVTEYGIVEVKDPYWTGGDHDLTARIARLQHVAAHMNGHGLEIEWRGHEFDPNYPTLGWERELAVTWQGRIYRITEGLELAYPDGTREPIRNAGLDPEAAAFMIEDKAPMPAKGFADLCHSNITGAVRRERWLEEHGLQTANLSLYHHKFRKDNRNTLPYVGLTLDQMDQVAYASDFSVMSHQLTEALLSPEAGAHALNKQQPYNAALSYFSSAAPICDSSFETTIGEHYSVGQEHTLEQEEGEWRHPVLVEDDYLRLLADVKPYDWREIMRVMGSVLSGSLEKPVPTDLVEILRMGDQKMGNNELPLVSAAARSQGPHTDRMRLDHGALELCAIGTSGGNLYVDNAVKELGGKHILALQLEYAGLSAEERLDQEELYKSAVEVGHINNIMMAVNGKDTRVSDEYSAPLTMAEMLQTMIDRIDRYAPEPVSEATKRELFAKLSDRDWRGECSTPDEIFTLFFQPESPMTANEAIRLSHELAPHLDVDELLALYSEYRRKHTYEIGGVYEVHED